MRYVVGPISGVKKLVMKTLVNSVLDDLTLFTTAQQIGKRRGGGVTRNADGPKGTKDEKPSFLVLLDLRSDANPLKRVSTSARHIAAVP